MTAELIVGGLVAAYVLTGLVMAILLWFNAHCPPLTIRWVFVSVLFSPLALVEFLITKVLALVAKS